MITPTQSAFVLGRLIMDNVIYEAMHSMDKKLKGRSSFMALKLDMSKSYNRVERGFLHAMMAKMGFHSKWTNLIMR